MNSAHLNASNVENLEPRAEANYLIKVKFCDFSNIEIQPTEKILKCVQCSKEFTDIAKVKSHLLTHTPDEFVTCSYCNDKFISQIKLNEHLKSHEANVAKSKNCFECVHCKRQFGFIDHLLNHFKVHFQNLRFSENELEEEDGSINAGVEEVNDTNDLEITKDRSFLMKRKMKKEMTKMETPKCIKEENTRETDNEEMKLDIEKDVGEEIYKDKMTTRSSIEQLNKLRKRKKKFFVCEYCQVCFDIYSIYIKHIRCHEVQTRNINRRRETSRGQYSCVQLIDNYTCTSCGITLSSMGKELTNHLTETHPEISLSKVCLYCGKLFASVAEVIRHIRVHTGEKPFACSECSFKCSRRDNLLSHFKTVHLNK